jgi:hypothetical protein
MGLDTSIASPLSTTGSSTPHTSASTEGAKTATAFDTIVPGFQAVNFSGSGHDRTGGQFDETAQTPSHGGTSSGPNVSSGGMGNSVATFPGTPMHGMSQSTGFVEMGQTGLRQIFPTQDNMFAGSTQGLPTLTLQVPEVPGLAYSNANNSPWYSSSDSTWSTPSDVSRFGGSAWPRDRSNSVVTIADMGNYPMPWSPGANTVHTPRSAALETVPESFESPPYLSPHFSPPMISYPLSASVSSPSAGYNMELVGTPTLSRPYKALAQPLSAPPTRLHRSTFREFDGGDTSMVDAQCLDRTAFEASTVMTATAKIGDYLTSYRTHLEPIYSIMHPNTSEHHMSELVKNSMAALGTQFHKKPEDRENGSLFHEHCAHAIVLVCPHYFSPLVKTQHRANLQNSRPPSGTSKPCKQSI